MDREMDAGRDGGGDPSEDHQGVGHAAGCLNRQRLARYRVRHTGSILVADAAVRTADVDFRPPFEPRQSSRDFRLHVWAARQSNDWTKSCPPIWLNIRYVSSAYQ